MNAAPHNVFIVDDDPSVRRATSRLMRAAGFEVTTFASAEEFLDGAPSKRPACLVLDVRLPASTGLDLQRELNDRGLDIPIVFITGHGDIQMTVQAMKAGAVDFLPKPFDDDDLLTAVRDALDYDTKQSRERELREAVRARYDSLTPREREVLVLVVSGFLNKQIGGRLGTSEKTVKVHRGRVMRKMRADSLAELVHMTEEIGVGRIAPGAPVHPTA
jgi:FixJ family two-component response regulator